MVVEGTLPQDRQGQAVLEKSAHWCHSNLPAKPNRFDALVKLERHLLTWW